MPRMALVACAYETATAPEKLAVTLYGRPIGRTRDAFAVVVSPVQLVKVPPPVGVAVRVTGVPAATKVLVAGPEVPTVPVPLATKLIRWLAVRVAVTVSGDPSDTMTWAREPASLQLAKTRRVRPEVTSWVSATE